MLSLVPRAKSDGPPHAAKRRVLAVCLIVVIIGSVAGFYRTGVERHRDARITWGAMSDILAMSIAISRDVYGLPGYLGYRQVADAIASALAPGGLTDLSEQSQALLADPNAIAEAFKRAVAIPRTDLPRYAGLTPAFVTTWAEDAGWPDLYSYAFRVFGMVPTAMYDFYFLVLTVSCLLAVASFWRNPAVLMPIAIFTASLLLLGLSDFFQPLIPSVNANRFVSTLAVVPVLHLAAEIAARARPSAIRLLALALQGIILAFSMSVRSSAAWAPLALALGCAALAVRQLAAGRKDPRSVLAGWAFPLIAIAVFAGTSGAYDQWRRSRMDPVYAQGDCIIDHHMRWHSMFYGFAYHPDWPKIKPDYLSDGAGDANEYKMVEHYLNERKVPETYVCSETGFYRAGLHEKVLKILSLQFMKAHPAYVLEQWFWYKPRLLIEETKENIDSVPMSVKVAVAVFILMLSAIDGLPVATVFFVWLGTTFAAVGASVPQIVSVPAQYVPEAYLGAWAVLLATVTLLGSAAVAAGRRIAFDRLGGAAKRSARASSS